MKLKLRWKTKLVAGQQDVIASSAVGGSYPLEVLRYNSRLWGTFCQITYETQLILMCVCLIKVLWISYHNFQARKFCSSSLKVMLGILIGKIGSEKPLGSSAAFLPESCILFQSLIIMVLALGPIYKFFQPFFFYPERVLLIFSWVFCSLNQFNRQYVSCHAT